MSPHEQHSVEFKTRDSGARSPELQALLDLLRTRRSRRFAKGMAMTGPLSFQSAARHESLSEAELATLAFAACGITGHALADLEYVAGRGGTMMASFLGRTVSSADAIHAVAVFVSDDSGTYYLKRPQDFSREEYAEVLSLSAAQDLVGLFRKSRVLVKAGRSAPSLTPPFNLDVNQWDLYAAGTSYFVPVNDYTYMYINGVLEFFNETMRIFVVDERKNFRPAGLAAFAGKRGHLDDSTAAGKTITIERLEQILQGVVLVEQGMVLQNLGLTAHAMGLGGFPNFAGHEFAWFEALGFRTQTMGTLEYLGASTPARLLGGLLGKNAPVHFPVGLEVDGRALLRPYCPPYYASMAEAVHAVVEHKWGKAGLFGAGASASAWLDPNAVARAGGPPSAQTIAAAIAYCDYLVQTYGRFPVYPAPYRTSVGFQCGHLDLAFYDRFYRADVVPEQFHHHADHWHR
jgi:hypothetical protein